MSEVPRVSLLYGLTRAAAKPWRNASRAWQCAARSSWRRRSPRRSIHRNNVARPPWPGGAPPERTRSGLRRERGWPGRARVTIGRIHPDSLGAVFRRACASRACERRLPGCAASSAPRWQKTAARLPFDVGHVDQAEVNLVYQHGGLEGIALGFVLHVPAGHEAQFRIDALRQPDQGSFVAAAPSLQQICDFLGARVDGQARPPRGLQKIYMKRGRFWASPAACSGGRRTDLGMISFRNGGN